MDEPGTVPNVPAESQSYLDRAPREVQQFVEAARTKKKKKQKAKAVENEEKVEEIVQPVDLGTDAYEQRVKIRRDISFDATSLRTFVITREVLGPPRSKDQRRWLKPPGTSQKPHSQGTSQNT
jgi:hypothetical protein